MWKAFKGELRDEDRVDLMIRDAAATQPAAFAPRSIFALEGLASDEPFGPDWVGVEPAFALKLLREAAPDVGTLPKALAAVARAWGLQPKRSPAPTDLRPDSKFVISGDAAIISVAEHFDGKKELDLADQATLVTDSPAERQLFGLAIALLESTRPARMLTAAAAAAGATIPERRIVS